MLFQISTFFGMNKLQLEQMAPVLFLLIVNTLLPDMQIR